MLWEPFLASIAPLFGLTTAQAGVVFGLLFTAFFAVCGGVVAPKYPLTSMIGPAFIGTVLFTYAEWLPTWTGSAMALVFALIIAGTITGKWG